MKTLFEKSKVVTKDMRIKYVRDAKTSTVKNADGTEDVIVSYTITFEDIPIEGRCAAGKDVVLTVFAAESEDGYRPGVFANLVARIDEVGTDKMVGQVASIDICAVHFYTPAYWLVKDEKGKVSRHLNKDGTPSPVTDVVFARIEDDTTSFDKMIERRILRILSEKSQNGGFFDTVTKGSDGIYRVGDVAVKGRGNTKSTIEEDQLDDDDDTDDKKIP